MAAVACSRADTPGGNAPAADRAPKASTSSLADTPAAPSASTKPQPARKLPALDGEMADRAAKFVDERVAVDKGKDLQRVLMSTLADLERERVPKPMLEMMGSLPVSIAHAELDRMIVKMFDDGGAHAEMLRASCPKSKPLLEVLSQQIERVDRLRIVAVVCNTSSWVEPAKLSDNWSALLLAHALRHHLQSGGSLHPVEERIFRELATRTGNELPVEQVQRIDKGDTDIP